MSHYRVVHQCIECGKIYKTNIIPTAYSSEMMSGLIMICGRCGCTEFDFVTARPKLFGLRGWDVREGSRHELRDIHLSLIDEQLRNK